MQEDLVKSSIVDQSLQNYRKHMQARTEEKATDVAYLKFEEALPSTASTGHPELEDLWVHGEAFYNALCGIVQPSDAKTQLEIIKRMFELAGVRLLESKKND